jgi:hypothetical protein
VTRKLPVFFVRSSCAAHSELAHENPVAEILKTLKFRKLFEIPENIETPEAIGNP